MANLTPQQATRQAVSAQWALSQLGSRDYYMLCQRFIENAYGTGGQYGSAAKASGALMNNTDIDAADVGDLVFFKPDPSNGNYGHVGIYVGNGEMVSATNGGITRDNIQNSGYWKNLLVGFGDPPDQWKGRSTSDQGLLQGAASLIQNAATSVGNFGKAKQSSSLAAWGGAGQWIDLIAQASEKYDIPINLLAAKVNAESGGKMTAKSGAGAQGLLQLMPATARSLGVTDPNDPAQNIDAGAKYFRQMYDQQGNWEDALRAYNAGPNGNWNNAETRNHVTKVMKNATEIGNSLSSGGGGGMPGSGFGGPGGGPPGSQEPPEVRRQRQQGNTPPPNLQPAVDYMGNLWSEFLKKFGDTLGENANSRQSITAPLVQGRQSGQQPGRMDNPFLSGIAGQEARDRPAAPDVMQAQQAQQAQAQAAAGPGGAGAPGAKPRPQGWVDPNTVPEAYRGILGASNDLQEQMAAIQERIRAAAPGSDEAFTLSKTYDNLLERWGQLAPSVAQIVQSAQKSSQGEFVPGTNASQGKWTIIKQDPVTGAITTQTIDNPNPQESDAQISASASNRNAQIAADASRYGSDISRQNSQESAGASRYGADVAAGASRYGADVSAGASRYGSDIARENALTQAETAKQVAALQAAVQQQQNKLDAQIRSGDLTLREATERWNQWYKTSVEAPLAVLQQQRETERYKIEGQNAVTQRATAQSEHERGVANIGQQMWQGAAQAYNQMIPNTVGAGWGEGFQRNLQGQGYQPNSGATFNTPESLDAFATRKVAEMLQGVSPYAQSIMQSQGAMGNPGQAMGGDQMAGLTQTATSTANNALQNPMQMPQLPGIQMPGGPDLSGFLPGGGGGSFPSQQQQPQLPDYSFNQGGSGFGLG